MARKTAKKIEGDVITISFPDAPTDETVVVDLNNLPPTIVQRLAMHGLSQKLGDATAGAEMDECLTRVQTVAEALKDPDGWTTRVPGSAGPRTTQLAEALAAATGKDVAEAAQIVSDLDDEGKKELRAHPQIKSELAKIKAAAAARAAEKAASEATTDAPDIASLLG
jgi:hypothetical protein